MRRRPASLLLSSLALVSLLVLAGCGLPTVPGLPDTQHPANSIADYDEKLWAQRPEVELSFTLAPDLTGATGHESIRFTPDDQACELVFRAWPNNPTMFRSGSALTVTRALVDGAPVTPNVQPAGAPPGAPGTLVELPLPNCLPPGRSVRADLDFHLQLGRGADERVGYDPDSETAWFGSAFPLLSWVRGQGWTRDPAERGHGETATSEDFTLTALEVTAPTDFQVTGTGSREGEHPGATPGTTVHRFRANAVRDVAVSVGRYRITEDEANGVRVHLATPSNGTETDPAVWVAQLSASINKLVQAYGPFPYADLWITVSPRQSDGSEFPGALQFGDLPRDGLLALIAHELAHQYFYGLVGNNQARDPWLDESFAAFSEYVVLGDRAAYRLEDVPDEVLGQLGRPMSFWANQRGQSYDEGVYQQGAAVLTELHRQIGPAFDADLRDYLADNAHRVATPADLAKAFADQPLVLTRLREAGALPKG